MIRFRRLPLRPRPLPRPSSLEGKLEHGNKVMQRLEEKVIPFFAQHLAFK